MTNEGAQGFMHKVYCQAMKVIEIMGQAGV